MEVAYLAEKGFVVNFILLQDLPQFCLELDIVAKMLYLILFDLLEHALNGIP